MAPASRRRFLTHVRSAVVVTGFVPGVPLVRGTFQPPEPPAAFPHQDAAVVREMVAVSHGNVSRVKALVAVRPALARASWEWGFGDWETALGAASHVGNKEIATLLLAAGAHPTIFSAAMLGQLDAVMAFVAASPGIQGTRGPHGISLLDHARAGQAAHVVKYLESVGGAHPSYPDEPFAEGDREQLVGTYSFGAEATHRMIVAATNRGALTIKREGDVERRLFHHGGREFNPAGAESVRIRFEPRQGPATDLTVVDGELAVRAKRLP